MYSKLDDYDAAFMRIIVFFITRFIFPIAGILFVLSLFTAMSVYWCLYPVAIGIGVFCFTYTIARAFSKFDPLD